MIYIPILKKLYYAEKGRGAFMNGKRLYVSRFKPGNNYILLLELKKKSRKRLYKIFKVMENEKNMIRAFACATYTLALVAEGNADVFMPLDTNLYDVASGIILIEEAGGKVTDIHDRKWNRNTHDYLFTNGKLHRRMLALIRKAGL